MAKKILCMTNQVALRSRFASFLNENNVPYEQNRIWSEFAPGFKKIVEVQYIVDEIYMNDIQLKAAMDATRGISFKVKEVA